MGKMKAWILWLGRAWPALAGVAALCLPLLSPHFRTETAVRFSGAAYQMLGVLLVSLGINGKLKHFYRLGVGERILRWLRESPAARKVPITISGHLTGPAVTGFGVATVEENLGHLSLEERIAKVYKKVLATDARLATTDHTIRTEVERLEAEIKAARASVPTHITAYRSELGGVLARGFKAEILGTALLLIGVLFGTLPGEVAWMFD
jgi:hypothetical protein